MRVVTDPVDLARGYLVEWLRLVPRLGPVTPAARVSTVGDSTIKFTYTLIGRERHRVNVWLKPAEEGLVMIAAPRYPIYLVATMLPLVNLAYFPLVVDTGNDTRAVLLPSFDVAVRAVAQAVTSDKRLVEPAFFLDPDVGFEGLLYETGIGRVAFLSSKPARLVDVIEDHEEDSYLGSDPSVVNVWDFILGAALERVQAT